MDSTIKTSLLCCWILGVGSGSAFAGRIFVVPEGQVPNPGESFTINANRGDELRLEVWVEDLPIGERLREWAVVLACSATGGMEGSIDHPPRSEGVDPEVDENHAYYVFAGLTTTTALTAAGCPSSFTPYAWMGVESGNGIEVTAPRYMATFTYRVSNDALDTFAIEPIPPSTSCDIPSSTWLRKDEPNGGCFEGVELGAITVNAMGTRMFLVPAGTDPTTTTAGQPFEVTARGGESITVEVFLEKTAPQAMRAYQLTMPCSMSGGLAGSVDFVSPAVLDVARADFAFAGVTIVGVGNTPDHCDETISCVSDADCPNWPPQGRTCDPATQTCFGGPRLGTAVFNSGDSVVLTDPRYLGEFIYTVSPDAETGAEPFTIRPFCIPADLCPKDKTFLRDDGLPVGLKIAFTLDELHVWVPRGQCCMGTSPVCEMLTETECTVAGGEFRADLTCNDLCECVSDAQCDDLNTCTADYCVGGDCENRPIRLGDIAPCGGDGVVDIDDIMVILNAFAGQESTCPAPCETAQSGAPK